MGMLENLSNAVMDTIIGRAAGAVGNKVGSTIDAAAEYARKLGRLKTFASRLIGLTEAAAKQKCLEQNLNFRVMRRNSHDYSFGGNMERRNDRVLVEVDKDQVTKAYLG